METALIAALSKEIERVVILLFEHYTTPNLVYHNLAHTQKVVSRAKEIAAHYPLSEADHFTLIAAAWWHDAGHLFAQPQNHEEESVRIMIAFFSLNSGVPQDILEAIEHAILATKMPQTPRSLVAEILCDADTYHLGTDEFEGANELVRQEARLRGGAGFGDWTATAAKLMRAHTFHTAYCLHKLTAGKAKNLERLLA